MRVLIVLFALFLTWAISSIVEEIFYERFCSFQKYRIEVYYLNGVKDTLTYNLPKNIQIFVSCHSSKGNFQGCSLEYLNRGLKLSSGHSNLIVDGVNSFKLIK